MADRLYLRPPRAVPGGGILLQGVLGQPVRAACSGRIVYVGSGIRGYGNLIIIKHDDKLLSAYAHTRELRCTKGRTCSRGQAIAQMGIGPHQIAGAVLRDSIERQAGRSDCRIYRAESP